MKTRALIIILCVCFTGAAVFGLVNRMNYRDFNKEESPLQKFIVGGLSQQYLERQLSLLENGDNNTGRKPITECETILAVRCEESSRFRHWGITQKVSVVRVFRGDQFETGDVLHLSSPSSSVWCYDEEFPEILRGYYGANLDFANEMIAGKEYLVFLGHRVESYRDEDFWVYYGGAPATRFCYEDIPNHAAVQIDDPDVGTAVYYRDVADCEFILTSDGAVEVMNEFKRKMLERFPLSSDWEDPQ